MGRSSSERMAAGWLGSECPMEQGASRNFYDSRARTSWISQTCSFTPAPLVFPVAPMTKYRAWEGDVTSHLDNLRPGETAGAYGHLTSWDAEPSRDRADHRCVRPTAHRRFHDPQRQRCPVPVLSSTRRSGPHAYCNRCHVRRDSSGGDVLDTGVIKPGEGALSVSPRPRSPRRAILDRTPGGHAGAQSAHSARASNCSTCTPRGSPRRR
jgi:hypothetical protein